MKGIKITYWVTTALVALMMVYSAYAYFSDPAVAQGFHHLGYPDYFRVQLAIAKLIGVVLLLAPVGPRFKEWTYAGFTFTFISATIAHSVSGDPFFMPVIMLLFLAASYITLHKLNGVKTA
ncbi:DoxX family protein [Chitinophaga agrisoli]|uniref:DoxX family protein n=1 Tax=Chitinophaga agrisoli TaxID=2607653 RepID=A0A5B2VIQ5_9BACT|nr:DoxX family protein [Chitinophaga agrisoli]KAA2238941.1 DoxX family protein [Chitinophaga agrisoli]